MSFWGRLAPPDAVEVIPGLHMGAAPSRRAARIIARAGVSYAVDLRREGGGGSPWPAGVRTLSHPMAEYEAPSIDALDAASGQIADLIGRGDVVYVHCRAGVQRAPMVACAVLLHLGWSLADSYRLVSSRRGVASLSEDQMRVLRKLADRNRRPVDVADRSH